MAAKTKKKIKKVLKPVSPLDTVKAQYNLHMYYFSICSGCDLGLNLGSDQQHKKLLRITNVPLQTMTNF